MTGVDFGSSPCWLSKGERNCLTMVILKTRSTLTFTTCPGITCVRLIVSMMLLVKISWWLILAEVKVVASDDQNWNRTWENHEGEVREQKSNELISVFLCICTPFESICLRPEFWKVAEHATPKYALRLKDYFELKALVKQQMQEEPLWPTLLFLKAEALLQENFPPFVRTKGAFL